MAMSPSTRRPAIPPVAGPFIPDDSRRNLDVPQAAELPEFLRRPGVLKDECVDFERVEFTGLEMLDGHLDVTDKLAQLFFVIGRDSLACSPTI
jgi:hypothetical protein